MNHEDPVRAALKALADYDRHRESSLPAPRLRAPQPPSSSIRTRWKMRTAYAGAALAAAATVLVLIQPGSEPVITPAPVEQTSSIGEPTPMAEIEAPDVTVNEAPQPTRRVVRQAKPILASMQSEPEGELTTEFFPLTESPFPFERGQLLRVVVPATTMQRVGLPVRPERWSDGVTADVLVSEEGTPRAIRFVSFQQ